MRSVNINKLLIIITIIQNLLKIFRVMHTLISKELGREF